MIAKQTGKTEFSCLHPCENSSNDHNDHNANNGYIEMSDPWISLASQQSYLMSFRPRRAPVSNDVGTVPTDDVRLYRNLYIGMYMPYVGMCVCVH